MRNLSLIHSRVGHEFRFDPTTGEISSTSDCTDFQADRLGVTYRGKPVHTVNGTACAIPRMLLAIGETHMTKDSIVIPQVRTSGFTPSLASEFQVQESAFKEIVLKKRNTRFSGGGERANRSLHPIQKMTNFFVIFQALRPYMGGISEMRKEPSFKNWARLPYYFFENRGESCAAQADELGGSG